MSESGRPLVLFFLLCLAVAGPSFAAAGSPDTFEGRWEGVILFKEGQIELDMVARFTKDAENGWSASLDLPAIEIVGREVADVQVEAGTVSLKLGLEGSSGEAIISGRLSAAGDTIEGSFERGGQSFPLHLERRDASAATVPVEVLDLPPGVEGFRERFNQERGKVRLVLLLSPT